MPVCLYVKCFNLMSLKSSTTKVYIAKFLFSNGQPTGDFFRPDIRSQTRNSINVLSILFYYHRFSSFLPVQMTFSTLKLVSKI